MSLVYKHYLSLPLFTIIYHYLPLLTIHYGILSLFVYFCLLDAGQLLREGNLKLHPPDGSTVRNYLQKVTTAELAEIRFLPRSVLKQHSETKLFETYLKTCLIQGKPQTTSAGRHLIGGGTYRKTGQQGTHFFQTRNPPVVSEELSASLQGNIYHHP